MKNNELAQKVKTLRTRKGLSQEELAEKTGLNLRTIQRIENGETAPRGDSLKRLAEVFGVSAEEITDWTVVEDKGYLMGLVLSALTFFAFPLLGIIAPLVMWVNKKGKVKDIDEVAKGLINFQITLVVIFVAGWLLSKIIAKVAWIVVLDSGRVDVSGDAVETFMLAVQIYNAVEILFVIAICVLYAIMIVVNAARINKGKKAKFRPAIRFLK